MRQRVARAPVQCNIRVQLPEPGDTIDDPSRAGPDQRTTVEIGVLAVTAVVPDSEAAERARLFRPAVLPAGLEPVDPMLQARRAASPVSFARRHP